MKSENKVKRRNIYSLYWNCMVNMRSRITHSYATIEWGLHLGKIVFSLYPQLYKKQKKILNMK